MIAIAVIFLIAMLMVSFAMAGARVASADTEFGKGTYGDSIGPGAASGFLALSAEAKEHCKPEDGKIRNNNNLLYVFFTPGATGTYTLEKDFLIIDSTWALCGATLKGTLDGAGHEIWNASAYSSNGGGYTGVSDYVGGLAAQNAGTIRNLKYYYTGGIYAKKVASAPYLAVGGMVGVNTGNIENCKISCVGSIETEGDAEGVTSCVGGVIGVIAGGMVSGCEIGSGCAVNAYTDKESSSNAKKSIVYAGGVVGKLFGGSLTVCRINSSASVMSADNTEKWEEGLGGLVGISTAYNDAGHIHPAGVVIGGVGNGTVSYCEVESSGSAISYGINGASNGGSIAGGFIGELSSGCNPTVQSNAVKLKCSLSAFMLESFDIVDTISSWFLDRNMTIYIGAAVGKCNANSTNFTNNYFAIEKDNGIIEDGADFDSDAGYDCEIGLLCGNGKLATLLGNNNWMSRKLSECDTGRIAGNDPQVGSKLHHLIIFGDGEVHIQNGAISGFANMTVEESPICSPFYGWTEEIGAAAPAFTTAKTKTLQNSMSNVLFAVFIDNKIESAGELTQLAKDINQIKLKVYENIGITGTKDKDGNPLAYFAGVEAPTLSWLNVTLEDDIVVRDGTPVIEDFYGTFNGNGHTLSFAAGSQIQHDFEKDADMKDEFSTESDPNKDITDYTTYSTGLFGRIMPSGVVTNLNVTFGGVIDASNGLSYKGPNKLSDKLKEAKHHEIDDSKENDLNSIYNNTFNMSFAANFTPDYDEFETVRFYGFKGDGYVAGRDYNPGYMEVVPYRVDIVVYTAYVGVLAGENYGTVTNVDVEATKSAFIQASGNTVYFGTLCGLNGGTIENVSVTMNGKVSLHARARSYAGGLFGVNHSAVAGTLFNGINVYVGGEITLERAINYHAVTYYMFKHASLIDGASETDGYSVIAYDSTSDDQDDAEDIFQCKDPMGVSSFRWYHNDRSVVTEAIGTLIGCYEANAATFANTAAISGAKGTFNTQIYNTDSTASYVGAMIGYLDTSSGGNVLPTFQNAWAVMSYDEFDKEVDVRRRPVASLDPTVSTGINLVYVQKTIAIANVNISNSLAVSFTLASQEGKTFSGWYDYTSGVRTVVTEGLQGTVFTPQNQLATNRIFVAEVLNLQLFSEEELRVLAASTNEGRGYADVEFTIGSNISLGNFTPIGTENTPFLGTLNGNGLTITLNSNAPGEYAGLFGCIGSEGTVKNLTVRVAGDIGNNATTYAGAVAAVNNGTIGQDTSTGKVVVEILGKIKGKYVGGVAGVNRRIVKNVEVYFLYNSEYDYGKVEADSASDDTVYAGGAIGHNQYVNEATIAKNVIVYYDNSAESTMISSKKTAYSVGGVIGENANGAAAYSLVSVFNHATIFGEDFAGSSGKTNKFRGLIVGHNASKNNTDSLWALCLSKSKTSAVDYDPELGDPLTVYRGSEEDVTTSQAVLMSGEDFATANILVKYGWGDVSVSISGAETVKGGQITFLASKLSRLDGSGNETVPEEKRVAFYDYVASFNAGARVPVAEGNTGYAFSPTVGATGSVGLTGKTYYAGFCNTTIASQADYIAVASNVANDYRLYVDYNVTSSFTLDETSVSAIGSAEKPFVGSVNGNANTVTMYSPVSLHAFIGVLGKSGDETYASLIKNLRLEIRSGSFIESNAGEAKGFLTDVNNGTIVGVNVAVHGYIKNNAAAGVVAGANYGKIDSAIVALEYAKAFGTPGFGAVFGTDVGAVAGINYGSIGSSMPNSIDVTISREGNYRGVLYGTNAVGGVAGVNEVGGVIRSAIVSFSGTVVGDYASALVGKNEGQVESALVTVESGAIYAGYQAFGSIAGANYGIIGHMDVGAADYEKVIKAYIFASPTYGDAIEVKLGDETLITIPATSTKAVGGVMGINAEGGVANAMVAEAHASLIASENAGNLAGVNDGEISSAVLISYEGTVVTAPVAGGVVGLNGGVVDKTVATLRGAIGSASSGENGIVASDFAGGVVGRNVFSGEGIVNTAVALYADVYGDVVGLGAGEATLSCAGNTWVQICNSSLTPVVGNSPDPTDPLLAGFNVIRVLNETLLNVSLTEKTNRLSFGSAIAGVKKWYTNISDWTSNSGFVSNLTNKLKYDPDGTERNVVYYVCYDELLIANRVDFNALATKINSHSYYNNVLFRLNGDIMVESGAVLRPIGTEEYPFNGIFDGNFYSVTLQTGSALSGPRYAGLFGYTAANSVIKNLVFTVEKGVSIGSVNSFVIGSLVGYNQGEIKNVFVNLNVNLTYNSQREYVGELIGYQASVAPATENVWISVLNGKDQVVGNMAGDNQFGVNFVGVLGDGMLEITVQGNVGEIRENYQAGNETEVSVKYSVPTYTDQDAISRPSYAARCQAYYDAFGGWYNDIRNEDSLIRQSTVAGLGDFSSNADNKDVWIVTYPYAMDRKVTLSFISLTIKTEADFIRFADNIKNYGDQGAVFRLESDIVVDFTNCRSVGTPEHPFTGTFNGNGHVITVNGNLIKREYAGVFGYVGPRGLIKDLAIEVGENVKFGDNDSLYSGVAVALLYGSVQSVVVRVHADTVVYTTQGRPSSGGIVGRAGKLSDDGTVVYDYSIDNCWLIVEENATVTDAMGKEDGAAYDAFYRTNGVGRILRIVGDVEVEDDPAQTNPFKKGLLKVSIDATNGNITFDANNGGSGFYGFIDNTTSDEAKMVPISDTPSNIWRWTVGVGNVYGGDKTASEDMLCVFINKFIKTTEEFLQISENVRLGRNYRGIIYELGEDIVVSADDLPNGVYFPIGGEVKIGSGTGYESFIERDFIGGFYGNGHTITFTEDVVIDARYAGLFGRVGADARIKNFVLNMNCEIGRDNAENTVRTIYAGTLAAYALGGRYDDVIVVLDKNASLFGSVGTGRAFGYLPKDMTGDVAHNCWAISYNSKSNYELNESEIAFNNGGEGNNQGGFNSLMVIAAGVVTVNQSGGQYYFTYSDPNADIGSTVRVNPYWYDRYRDEASGDYWHTSEDYHGTGWSSAFRDDGYHPTGEESRRIYNVSFLKSEIASYADLQKYATNVNEGYNFYKLTFTLESDIVLEDDFAPIGTALSGMNGTFDGKKHTITLPKNVVIEGEYAGVFGYVSEDGEIVNLRIVLAGAVGKNTYTQEQIDTFHVANTRYAGAVAYNKGVLTNVIVVSEGATLNTLEGIGGLAVAYDATNLLENVWALVDASSYVDAIGVCAVGDTRVNTMTVIGIGVVTATFDDGSYQVKFTSDGVVPVMGWYKSFEKNQQISKAMLSSGDLANGTNGYLIAPADYSGVKYEVAVIKTTVATVEEMIAIAEDVNVGGYTFENITFNLGADIAIPGEGTAQGYISIGTAEHHFKGTFSGKDDDVYHTITVSSGYVLDGVFGYNAGTISDLTVVVRGTVGRRVASSDNVYGAVACVNAGTILRTYVEVKEGGVVTGYTVGGVAGSNLGRISDVVVVVREGGVIRAETARRLVVNAGAVAGVNYGTIEGASDFTYWSDRELLPDNDNRIARIGESAEANVLIYGTVSAVSTAAAGSAAATNAGGAVGNQNDGVINYMIVYLADSGVVESHSPDDGMARAGGFVGYAKASMNHSVTFLYGTLVSDDHLGGTAGYLDGVITMNVWQVTLNRIVDGAGEGAKTVNSLNVKGNGKIKAAIDLFTKRIIFTNVTEVGGSKIDGWYTAPSVEVDDKTGNVGESGNTFLPLGTIQNKYVMVIFVNTKIYSAADLNDMASSVSGGLSGNTIVFTLMNDITVEEGDLTALIGTAEYPFNNVFDGMGYKITLQGNCLFGEEYCGLFGYTGATAVIRNLTIDVRGGNYGKADAERSAILVAYNEGLITNLSVNLSQNACIYGGSVAVVAATSFGDINDVTLTLEGRLFSYAENTATAGGLVGANEGEIKDITITATDTFRMVAYGVTSYVGLLAGENYKTIRSCSIFHAGEIDSNGTMTGYSGTAVGVNLGNVYGIYAEIDQATFDGGVSGGLVGNNVNALTSSLVKIVDNVFTGTDSVVGYAKAKDAAKVHNVWVYSDRMDNVSKADCINSMICGAGLTLSCPTAEDVKLGKIEFTSEITDLRTEIAFFAAIDESGSSSAGTGAVMDNVVYTSQAGRSYVTYLTYDMVSTEAVSRLVADVRVRFVTRATMGSGSEFYAFALAVNSGAYTFENAAFSLNADFALPERAFPSIALPQTASLNGGHHVITVGNAALSDALFASNAGTIENVGLRFTNAGTAVSLVENNAGTICNAVVYLERGVTLTGGEFFATSNTGVATNLWLVVREDTALGQGSLPYAIVKINGVGNLAQGGGSGLTFSAVQSGDVIFIGYTAGGAIFSSDALFDSAEKQQVVYTAEFISKTLDTDYKLQVLSDVTALGYTGADETFTVGTDLVANNALFTAGNFVGTILGNGYTLKAEGVTGGLFGLFGGRIESLIVDLTEGGSLALFDSANTVVLDGVVILEERAELSVGATVTATNVWVVSENEELYEAFLGGSYAAYSLLYKNGDVTFAFDNGIKVSAADDELQVFAGWYGERGSVFGTVVRENVLSLPTSAGNVWLLNYINRTFTSADDLERLSTAVKNGFEFEGVTFRVADNGFTVDRKIKTIGNEMHVFKGNIYGGNKSTIVYDNYGGESTFEVEPFLYRLIGEIKELIFVYEEGAVFTGAPALVCENAGKMQGIVVIDKCGDLFDGGAALTLSNDGEIKNSWLVTKGTESAVGAGSRVGVNEMRVDDTTVDVSFSDSEGQQGTRVIFHLSSAARTFLCLYDFDGEVVFPGNYSSGIYTAPATATGSKISVKSINEIRDQNEFVYLGYATSARNLAEESVIKLASDVEVKRNLKPIRFKNLTLDLNGHYLDLTASTATAETVIGTDDRDVATSGGIVKNGSVYLRKGCYGIGEKGLTLQNVVLFMANDGMTLPDYNLAGTVKIVTEDKTRKTEITSLSGTYTYLYAPKAAYAFEDAPAADAAIRASFDETDNYKIGFVGQENELYYYGGIDNLSGVEDIAYFAAKTVDTAEKFSDLAHAAELSEDALLGATVTVAADITVDGTKVRSLLFAGTLLGGGHTVTVTGGNFSGAYLTLLAGGSASDLALAFKSAAVTAENLVVTADENEGRIVVIVYQAGAATQTETQALTVNVYGEGEIDVAFGETVAFTAKESGNYALRKWTKAGEDLGRVLTVVGDQPLAAYFELRYFLRVEYIGVDEDILKKNESDLPTFSGIGVCFASDIVGDTIAVAVEDIGKGFFFKGLSSVDAQVNVGANAWTYAVTVTSTYDVTLKAELTYIPMVWESVEYKADETSFTAYDGLKSVLEGQGYEVEYKYSALDDTPPLVSMRPYHAGSYLVSFRIYSGSGVNRRMICDASSGLIIKKAVLTFVNVAIEDKVYDGTTTAEKSGEPVLSGFKGDDGNYITIEGLTFTFADANAGQGKLVYVSGDGTLGYKAAAGAAEKYKYVYRNYDFDAGSVTSGGEIVRANIRLRTLVLSIDSISVEYLKQFDPDAPVLTPTVVSGLIEKDRAAFENLATALVTRENADSFDVGFYRIIVGDSFAFPNYEVKLTPGAEAYYIVTPSEIIVEFDDDDTMIYGDRRHAPKYHVYVGVVDGKQYRDLREGDELIFDDVVYNDGNELLPSDAKYSFTCLFSSANKNYTVKTEGQDSYRIVGGVPVAILQGSQTLTVTPKPITVVADDLNNVKRFGKRTETLRAELASGNSFVERGAKLVVSRAKGETVGRYELSYAVKGESGEDLTSRYLITTQSGEPYYFTINPVAILIKPTKTQIIYGNTVEMINYGKSVEGGGITMADLYYATNWRESNSPEKENADLADIGITLALSEGLKTVLNVGEYDASFDVVNDNPNISEIRISGAQKMIVVQKRYLKLIIKDVTKKYNGSADVSEALFGYTVDPNAALLAQDKKNVKIKEHGYTILRKSASVGIYKIDGDFSLEGAGANNYYLTFTQGNLTINAVDAAVTAEIGYFDESGAFKPATVMRGGTAVADKIYYGDSRAVFKYSLTKEVPFVSVPTEGTDKEISDYIASFFKISHDPLNGLVPDYYEANKIGIIAANNNFNVKFTASFDVEPVRLTLQLVSGTKRLGEPDPEIGYKLIAIDPNNGNEVISDYDKIAKGTFEVIISAERSEGESLGTYKYSNIKVDIKNAAADESLIDEGTESGKAMSADLTVKQDGLSLKIKQKNFLRTVIGKIVTYGLPILILAALAVFLIIYIPRAKKKKAAGTPDDPTPTDGAKTEGEQPSDENAGSAEQTENAEPAEQSENETAEGEEPSADPASEAGDDFDVSDFDIGSSDQK